MTIDVHELDPAHPEPLYVQLAENFRRRIHSGFWPVHHKLPAEPEFAQQLGVSRGTLRAAIALLVQEGLVAQVHGKGTFVASGSAQERVDTYSLSALLERANVDHTTRELDREVLHRHAFYEKTIGRGPFLRLRRVRALPEGPFTLMENVLALKICGAASQDIPVDKLYQTLEQKLGLQIGVIRRTVASTGADADAAAILGVPVNAPVLQIEQVASLTDGRPFEFATAIIRTDRHKLTMDVNHTA